MKTQTQRVMDYIVNNGSISDQEAQIMRVRSLSRRIVDLAEEGYGFSKEWKRDDFGQRYVSYSIA
jgi:hypothetical protein